MLSLPSQPLTPFGIETKSYLLNGGPEGISERDLAEVIKQHPSYLQTAILTQDRMMLFRQYEKQLFPSDFAPVPTDNVMASVSSAMQETFGFTFFEKQLATCVKPLAATIAEDQNAIIHTVVDTNKLKADFLTANQIIDRICSYDGSFVFMETCPSKMLEALDEYEITGTSFITVALGLTALMSSDRALRWQELNPTVIQTLERGEKATQKRDNPLDILSRLSTYRSNRSSPRDFSDVMMPN